MSVAVSYPRGATSGEPTCPTNPLNAAGLHVAYLINQYPKASHSFIRREIQALERYGVRVDRIAIRGWDAELVDPEDVAEQKKVWFVLRNGLAPLALALVRTSLTDPRRFLTALVQAISMRRSSKRSLAFHILYLAQACAILRWIRSRGAGHLHAHFGTNPAEIAMLVRLLGGPPYSFTVHGMDEIDRGAFLGLDRKVRLAKFAVAVSHFNRSQLFRQTSPENWGRIRVVHCGLEKSFYDVASAPLPEQPVFVCVGRLSEEKGQLVLLEALRKLRDRGIECQLVLAGDGPMRNLIEQRIQALGLKGNIRITGWITSSQVRQEIQAARALVLPSFIEGLPVVIMEALALRRPVIASNIAGIPELVQSGEHGWLVPAGSSTALSEAMLECIKIPGVELAKMTARGYARVLQRHDVDKEAGKLVNYFRHPLDTHEIAG
jgi:colanic acid/amylovoran biosynthesis glycosyltransferase